MVRPLLFPLGMKLVIAAVVAATTATAFAEPVPSETPPVLTPPSETPPAVKVPTATEWYGWQIAAADAAAFGMAAATEHGEIALAWIGTGAAVHAAHHNYGRSFLSVGMRVGLPILGASLGEASAKGCQGELCDLGPMLLGGLVGMGAAELIDLAIAKDEHEIVPVHVSRGWTPVASVRHTDATSSATLGIAARF